MGSVAISRVFRFGLFEADAAHNTLTRGGVRVKIQEQPFHALLTLLEKPGEIVTREELRQKLWPAGTFVDFEGSLNVIFKRLRAVFDDDPDNPRFIETVPRKGYRFIAPVSVQDAEPIVAAGGASLPAIAAQNDCQANLSSGGKAARQSPVFRAAVVCAAVLAILAIVLRVSWYRKTTDVSRLTLSAHASAPVAVRRSVAVLGFRNVSAKAEDAWLAAAFSEMLSTELAGGDELRLVSEEEVTNLRLSSPWSPTDTLSQETTARVGSALNSDLLVLGSYATLGPTEHGQVRLDVRLQDSKTGGILTEIAETGRTRDVLEIVSRVGDKLRDNLRIPRLESQGEAAVQASLPADRDAARFYALGIAKLREFDLLSAKELLQQACDADPKFPQAHLMLARAWGGLGYEQKRKEEAKKAFELSTNLPRTERLQVEGDYYDSLADHEQAASAYRALFALFPDSVDYGLLLANAQNASGHPSQASQTVAQLRKLPPPASEDPRLDITDMWATQENNPQRLALIQSAVRKAASQQKKLVYAEARRTECMVLIYSDHPEQAPLACDDAYNVFLSLGNRLGAADAIRLTADYQGRSQPEQVLATYRRALGILQGLGDHYKTGAILNNMAIVLANQGKLEQAEELYRQAKFHFQQAGDKGNTALALGNIADIVYLRGDLSGATKLYQEALDMQASVEHSAPSYLWKRLADLQLTRGHPQDALHLAQKAVEAIRATKGGYGYLADALMTLGEIEKAGGDFEGARRQFQEALELSQKTNETRLAQESREELAELDLDEGHADAAEPPIREVIPEFEKGGQDPDAISAYTLLSRALLMQGKRDEARKAIEHAQELAAHSPDPALKLPITIQTVRVEMAEAEQKPSRVALVSARQHLGSAKVIAHKLGYYGLECSVRLALAELEMEYDASAGRAQLQALAAETHDRGFELVSRQAKQLADGAGSAAPLSKIP